MTPSADCRREEVDGFVEAAVENLFEGGEGHGASVGDVVAEREMEAMNGVEEEMGAHAFVEIGALAAEPVEGGGFGQQGGDGGGAAEGVERAVADLGRSPR